MRHHRHWDTQAGLRARRGAAFALALVATAFALRSPSAPGLLEASLALLAASGVSLCVPDGPAFLRLVEGGVFLGAGAPLFLLDRPESYPVLALFAGAIALGAPSLRVGRGLWAILAALALGAPSTLARSPGGRSSALDCLFAAGYLAAVWIACAEESAERLALRRRLRSDAASGRFFVRLGGAIQGVVHDLNSKLMSVNGFNELIREGAQAPVLRDYAALQKGSIEELGALIEDLQFAVRSRARTGEEVFSLARAVRSSVELLSATRRDGVRFSLDLSRDGFVLAPPYAVAGILDALLDNALDAAGAVSGGSVAIRLDAGADAVACAIRDNGGGLPFCAACPRTNCIACRKFRLGRSTKPARAGAGVVAAQELLAGIGGRLRYATPPGSGTLVTVWFPAASLERR